MKHQTQWTDSNGIERYRHVDDLPMEALRCAARFFHPFDGGVTIKPSTEYPNAMEVRERCTCTRQRVRVIDNVSGQDLRSFRYEGGAMVEAGTLDRRVAYLLWLRAQRRALMKAVPS